MYISVNAGDCFYSFFQDVYLKQAYSFCFYLRHLNKFFLSHTVSKHMSHSCTDRPQVIYEKYIWSSANDKNYKLFNKRWSGINWKLQELVYD